MIVSRFRCFFVLFIFWRAVLQCSEIKGRLQSYYWLMFLCLSVETGGKQMKGLVHSPTNRLRMRADSPVCSAERPLCLLYHWPFHIPQPACGSGPSLAATLRALFEFSSVTGRFACFWLGYVDLWLLYFYSRRNAYEFFPCLKHLVESGQDEDGR